MDPLPLLQDLVSIPSVNPMGRDLTGPEYFEGRLTDYLVQFLTGLGVPCEQREVLPGRCNVIARYDSPGSQSTIVLDGHQDTVPVDGMTIPPFGASVRDGRLYGRGACDVKGGLAAMLAAFARLVREKPAGAANVVMACTCDEEAGGSGALALAKTWSEGRSPLLPVPPDLALVAEPTDLDIVVAHRGASRWKIKTTGRACHSSRPSEGVNAIYKMAKVVQALEVYADELPHMRPPHPLCGPPTLSVGRIEGGISVNTVPDFCTIEIDRRCVPGEDGWEIIHHVETYLRRRLDVDFEMVPPWLVGMSLSDENNGTWADRLMAQIEAVAGPRKKMGVPYGTNASRYSPATPALVFGPGSILQAHTVDEWISVDELRTAADIYYRFCAASGG